MGAGESEGRVGAIPFYFPQPLAFFGFSPHNFLIRAKMHKSKKETKGGRHDPILTHSEGGHKAGGPNGGGWGGFPFGWMDVGAKEENLKIGIEKSISCKATTITACTLLQPGVKKKWKRILFRCHASIAGCH